MKHITLLLGAAVLWCTSCIDNDIPYPIVPVEILGLEGEGFAVEHIDPNKRTVTLTLEEKTDIRQVKITRTTFNVTVPGSLKVDKEKLIGQISTSQPLTGTFDLRTPLYVNLSLYQDYEWTISAVQTIERRFQVAGQIGSAEFDETERTARARVTMGTDLEAVVVTDLKLGPEDITTYSPTAEELSGSSFKTVRFVDVTCHDVTERWLLYVEPSQNNVELTTVDPWTKFIRLEGAGIEGSEMGFRYRKPGEETWQEVNDVRITGSNFAARMTAEPATTYEIAAYCDEWVTPSRTVTTDIAWELPNGGFEEWEEPDENRKYWIPFLTGSAPFWDTGNQGATSIREKDNVTTGAEDPRPGSSGSKSARLASRWIFIKFAAGNLFTGEYFHTFQTNGVVGFGRPCPHRPTALRGWVKFKGGKINRVDGMPSDTQIVKNETDENGIIYIALGTWKPEEYGTSVTDVDGKQWTFGTETTPVAVYTKDYGTFFNPKSKDVIAYGEKIMVEDIDEWQEFRIDIDYRRMDILPTHLVIVCSASRWGDYFTGYDKSVLCVDDFELLYD